LLLDGTEPELKRPKVLGVRSLTLALALHLALFLFAFLFATVTRKPNESVIPIDLTVVVQENLDGNEDEPPPLKPPTPEQPKSTPPPPKPEPKPEPPKIKDDPKIDAVEKVPEKPKAKEKKKTAAELKKEKEKVRQDRLKKIREKGKLVKGDKKPAERQPNGKTGKKTLSDAEIQRLLNQGYKPGRTEQLATSEYQRCISLISAAFYEKWDRPPWTDTLRVMHLSIRLGSGGRILSYKLTQSSGDSRADATVLQAASLVRSVSGLSPEFISQNKTVTVRFKVAPK
jgi:TonB family protein